MNKLRMLLVVAAGALLMVASAPAQDGSAQGYGQTVVTVLPAHPKEWTGHFSPRNVNVKVAGKEAKVTGWKSWRDADVPTQLVLLIDGSARMSLGAQLGDIRNFVKEMPAHTKMAIAYMTYGRAVMATPLSSNPQEVLRGLHLPDDFRYGNASPYFCLSSLAKRWPSQDRTARRVVVMITDGVDEYETRYDPEDPYVLSAIHDSIRAGLIVYAIYWRNRGFGGFGSYQSYDGQNLLSEVTEATGGENFWIGSGDPVALEPFFKKLKMDLNNQYELSFSAPHKGKPEIESLHLKMSVPSAKVLVPQEVYVGSNG
jgi:hypothetical protein